MIPGNTERGRRWRRNEDALPLLGNKLADRYDIWRKHTEWALAILENDTVEILGALFERLPLKAPAIANSTTK
jgi:hypothetical protein